MFVRDYNEKNDAKYAQELDRQVPLIDEIDTKVRICCQVWSLFPSLDEAFYIFFVDAGR